MKRMHDDSEVKKLAMTALKPFLEEIASTGLKREIVTSLPTGSDIKTNVIYMIYNSQGETSMYDEYLRINDTWELIGKSEADFLNPMTSEGDMIYGDSHGKPERLARANVGDILKMGRVNSTYKPVWAEDNYLEVYEIGMSDIESFADDTFTFTNDFKDKVTSMRYALLLDTSLLQIGTGETLLLEPSGIIYSYFDADLYFYSVPAVIFNGEISVTSAVFIDDETTHKLTLQLAYGAMTKLIQESLETNIPPDDTLVKVLGYNSGDSLVKGTVSGGGTQLYLHTIVLNNTYLTLRIVNRTSTAYGFNDLYHDLQGALSDLTNISISFANEVTTGDRYYTNISVVDKYDNNEFVRDVYLYCGNQQIGRLYSYDGIKTIDGVTITSAVDTVTTL